MIARLSLSAARRSLWGLILILPLSLHLTARGLAAAELQPITVQAWDRYLQWTNHRVEREVGDAHRFLTLDFLAEPARSALRRRIEAGEVVSRPVTDVVPAGIAFQVPDGEIHHWWGCVFVPNVTLPQLLGFLQDYDHHAGRFPEVERSRLVARDGNHFRFALRLKRSKSFVTVTYNTEQECTYKIWSAHRVSSQSSATRIVELENPGTRNEFERPPGNDRGFLWRLVSWWRFQEASSGVIVELESASLSRDIPSLIRFIPGVSGYIRETPRESIVSVLTSVREYAAR
jgi:hypothetical protein